MKRLALILLLGLTFSLPGSSALAAADDAQYPGAVDTSSATDLRSRMMVDAAVAYWTRMGYGDWCPSIDARLGTVTYPLAVGVSWFKSCRLVLDTKYVFDAFRVRQGGWTRNGRHWAAKAECGLWTHEVGHAVGADSDHTSEYPVMQDTEAPVPECRELAQLMHPYKPKRRKCDSVRRARRGRARCARRVSQRAVVHVARVR